MKEERRAREVRDKIKEKMARGGNEREDALEDKFDQIGDYRIYTNDIIGEGSYGKVFKARKINDPQLLACKVISKAKL
jgi:hypothetical protein